jgi:hypothetical protein
MHAPTLSLRDFQDSFGRKCCATVISWKTRPQLPFRARDVVEWHRLLP